MGGWAFWLTAAALAGPAEGAESTVPPAPSDPVVFDDVVHSIDLEIDPALMVVWDDDHTTYLPATLSFDEHVLREVAVRLKGNSSRRPVWDKPALKIDLNRDHPGRRLAGMKSLTLNNAVFDCTSFRDRLSAEVMRQLDLPHSRVAHAWVRINRVPKGLYVIAETQDDVWLRRHVVDATGPLYDGKFRKETPESEPVKSDLTDDHVDHFQLEEGSDRRRAELHRVVEQLEESEGDLDEVDVDWALLRRTMAAEEWLGQWDGYARNRNNYRVYVDPVSGLLQLMTNDFDKAFRYDKGDDWLGWLGNEGERGVLADRCLADPGCTAAYIEELAAVDERLDEEALLQFVEDHAVPLAQLIETDPYGALCPRLPTLFDELTPWIEGRSDYVAERVAP